MSPSDPTAVSHTGEELASAMAQEAARLDGDARADLLARLAGVPPEQAVSVAHDWAMAWCPEWAELMTQARLAALLEAMRHLAEAGADRDESAPVLPSELWAQGEGGLPAIEAAAKSLQSRRLVGVNRLRELAASARQSGDNDAFLLAGAAVAAVRSALVEAAQEGHDQKRFVKAVAEQLTAVEAENVFRSNVLAAYSDGQDAALKHPVLDELFPYAAYLATRDRRARKDHLALEKLGLDGTNVYRRDDPTFVAFRPPWSYQCRCTWRPVGVREAAALGVKEAQEWLASGLPPVRPARVGAPPFAPDHRFRAEQGAAEAELSGLSAPGDGAELAWEDVPRPSGRGPSQRQWRQYHGPHGGRGWKNIYTGEVRYQEASPDVRQDAIGGFASGEDMARRIARLGWRAFDGKGVPKEAVKAALKDYNQAGMGERLSRLPASVETWAKATWWASRLGDRDAAQNYLAATAAAGRTEGDDPALRAALAALDLSGAARPLRMKGGPLDEYAVLEEKVSPAQAGLLAVLAAPDVLGTLVRVRRAVRDAQAGVGDDDGGAEMGPDLAAAGEAAVAVYEALKKNRHSPLYLASLMAAFDYAKSLKAALALADQAFRGAGKELALAWQEEANAAPLSRAAWEAAAWELGLAGWELFTDDDELYTAQPVPPGEWELADGGEGDAANPWRPYFGVRGPNKGKQIGWQNTATLQVRYQKQRPITRRHGPPAPGEKPVAEQEKEQWEGARPTEQEGAQKIIDAVKAAREHAQTAGADPAELIRHFMGLTRAELRALKQHLGLKGEGRTKQAFAEQMVAKVMGGKLKPTPPVEEEQPAEQPPVQEQAPPEEAPPEPEQRQDNPPKRQAQKAPWDMTVEEVKKAGIKFYRTGQGSLYAVHPETGQTIRVKSPHAGHDAKDVGLKRGSEKTVYLDPKDAQRVGMWQTLNASNKRAVFKDGKIYLVSKNPKTGEIGLDEGPIDYTDKPEIGRSPLELNDRATDRVKGAESTWSGTHPGSPISEEVSVEDGHKELVDAAEKAGKRSKEQAPPEEAPPAEKKPFEPGSRKPKTEEEQDAWQEEMARRQMETDDAHGPAVRRSSDDRLSRRLLDARLDEADQKEAYRLHEQAIEDAKWSMTDEEVEEVIDRFDQDMKALEAKAGKDARTVGPRGEDAPPGPGAEPPTPPVEEATPPAEDKPPIRTNTKKAARLDRPADEADGEPEPADEEAQAAQDELEAIDADEQETHDEIARILNIDRPDEAERAKLEAEYNRILGVEEGEDIPPATVKGWIDGAPPRQKARLLEIERRLSGPSPEEIQDLAGELQGADKEAYDQARKRLDKYAADRRAVLERATKGGGKPTRNIAPPPEKGPAAPPPAEAEPVKAPRGLAEKGADLTDEPEPETQSKAPVDTKGAIARAEALFKEHGLDEADRADRNLMSRLRGAVRAADSPEAVERELASMKARLEQHGGGMRLAREAVKTLTEAPFDTDTAVEELHALVGKLSPDKREELLRKAGFDPTPSGVNAATHIVNTLRRRKALRGVDDKHKAGMNKVMDGLEKSGGDSQYVRRRVEDAQQTFKRLGAKAAARLEQAQFHYTTDPKGMREASIRHWMQTDKMTRAQAENKWVKSFGSMDIRGVYNFGPKSVFSDGDSPDQPARSVFAHELAHHLDGEGWSSRISDTDEWKEAWRAEIVGDPKKPAIISQYSRDAGGRKGYEATEGWAEFGRILLEGLVSDAALRKYFPRCLAVWRKHGLISLGDQAAGQAVTASGYSPPEGFKPAAHNVPNDAMPEESRRPISREEADALREYTGTAYRPINEALWAGREPDGSARRTHERIQAAFAKQQPWPRPVTVHRGLDFKDPEAYLGRLRQAGPGGVVRLAGYQSASTKAAHGGNVQLKIAARHGLDLAPYSHNGVEREVLLNHNGRYKVAGIEEGKDQWGQKQWTVSLEQLEA